MRRRWRCWKLGWRSRRRNSLGRHPGRGEAAIRDPKPRSVRYREDGGYGSRLSLRSAGMTALPAVRLFRRLEHRRLTGAELLQQRGFVRLRGHQMPRFHMAEAADFLRDGRKAHRNRMIVGRELAHQFAEQRLVIGDQLALGAALFRVPENVERG